MNRGAITVCLAVLLILPGATSQGGGDVQNRLAQISSFERSGFVDAQAGDEDILCGTIHDSNGENDLLALTIRPGDGFVNHSHTINGTGRSQATPPSDFDAGGWMVWNPSPDDGALSFRFRFVYPAQGDYNWSLVASDEAGAGPSSATKPVSVAAGPSNRSVTADACATTPASSTPATAAPPSGGGGGGGGGGGARSTGEGTGTGHGGSLEAYDITESLAARRSADEVRLQWDPVPEAMGYQVWVHEGDAWTLVATLDADQDGFQFEGASSDARYKLTFFEAEALSAGFATDGAEGLFGWRDDFFVTAIGPVERAFRYWFGVELVKWVAGAGLLWFLWRRRSKQSEVEPEQPDGLGQPRQ